MPNRAEDPSAACVADIAGVKSIVDSLAATTSLPRQQVLDAQHTADIAVEIVEQRSDLDMMDKSNARDRFMAENVKWFSRTMFPGARIAVWAHDGHVMTSNSYGMIPMGTYLRSWYGAAYYVVGFAFYSGSTSPNGVSPPIMLWRCLRRPSAASSILPACRSWDSICDQYRGKLTSVSISRASSRCARWAQSTLRLISM